MKARVPSNNQPNFTVHHRSKQQLRNENIIGAMITSYIMSQEAMTTMTTVDPNKHARLHKQQITFSIDVNQPH
jgi:hypothetical protein